MEDSASASISRPQKGRKRQRGWTTGSVSSELFIGSAEGGFQCLEEFQPTAELTVDGTTAKSSVKRKQRRQLSDLAPAEALGPAETRRSNSVAVREAEINSEGRDGQPEDAARGGTKKRRAQVDPAPVAEPDLSVQPGVSQTCNTEDGQERCAEKKAAKKLSYKDRKKLERKAFLAARKQDRRQKAATSTAAESPPTARGHEVASSTSAGAPTRANTTAWKSFGLEEEIECALGVLGFSFPTPIQRECLPPAIRDGRDVIGAAQTGSGKTLAFGLPILQRLLREKKEAGLGQLEGASSEAVQKKQLEALILAPTRELAMQVSSHLEAISKPCDIWVVPIIGGISAAKQERLLQLEPEVVVATPGRLWQLISEGAPHLTDLSGLCHLVLDEADRMVQQGHFEELSNILDLVNRGQTIERDANEADEDLDGIDLDPRKVDEPERGSGKPRSLQTFVFSATLTMPDFLRKRLRKGGGGASGSATLETLMDKIPFQQKPKIADLTSEHHVAENVTEAYLECTEDDRDDRLYYILSQHPGRTLIFANAISTVRRLAALLRLLQLPAAPLHASMQQRQRLKALDRFRSSNDAILVATDVAARGLDIQDVTCVIHYQVPAAVDVYVHRCGRTARAGADGVSIAFVAPKESQRFSALLKGLGRSTPPLFPLEQGLLPGARKRVRLAARLDEVLRLRSKEAARKSWEARAASAAGVDLSDAEGEDSGPGDAGNDAIVSLREELTRLLQEPLQPKFSQRYFTGALTADLASRPQAAICTDDHAAGSVTAVGKAIGHAQRLVQARSAAVERTKGKSGRKKPRSQALPKRETQAKRTRLVVIPSAVGREGVSALQALRARS